MRLGMDVEIWMVSDHDVAADPVLNGALVYVVVAARHPFDGGSVAILLSCV